VKLIFNYETVHCFDGTIVASLDSHLIFGMYSKGGSKSVIVDNVISHNGLSGLSFDGGSYEVKSNKIFENWLWGLMVACDVQCNCSSQSRILLRLTEHHRHHIYQECKILNTLFHR
jgi:hypothetical protein